MRQRIKPHIFLMVGLAVLNFVGTADAQLEVSITLDKDTYVVHEDILATITVFNRAGRDIILDGPGTSWMEFYVKK